MTLSSSSFRPSVAVAVVLAALAATPAVAQSDTQPPSLVGFAFTPDNVDVSAAAQTVTFTLHVTDDLSGIDTTSGQRLQVLLQSPSGKQHVNGVVASQAGVILDGSFSIAATIPLYSEAGAWTIRQVFLGDNAGNRSVLSQNALSAAGFPTILNVADTNQDLTPPQLAAFSMSPPAVDVSSRPATITVLMTLTDDLSGIQQNIAGLDDFELTSPSGNQLRIFNPVVLSPPISGTLTDGVWRSAVTMPRYSETGTWALGNVTLRDRAGNTRSYSASQLFALFGDSIQVTVSAVPSDTTPPQVTGLSFVPAFIDTSLGPQPVQVHLSASDDLSGVSFVGDDPFISEFFGLELTSPSGAQNQFTNLTFADIPPTSGTPTDGTWTLQVDLPQFSEEGTWTAAVFLKDVVRNVAFYTNAQLAALNLPTQALIVIKPSLQPDGSIADPAVGGVVADSVFGTRAELIVPGGVLSAPTSVAIDVLQSPLGIPSPRGFSTAETYFVNVQLVPEPAFPLPAPGMTMVLPLRNYVVPGTAIQLFSIDPTTALPVPALDSDGRPVIGSVDRGGMAATFSGISHFSTLVGFLPDALPVTIDIEPGRARNVIHLDSRDEDDDDTVSVAILSTLTFDATSIDPATVTFSGARVARNERGKFRIRRVDINKDAFVDLVAEFTVRDLLLGPTDTQGIVEGLTRDGRLFRGTDTVKVVIGADEDRCEGRDEGDRRFRKSGCEDDSRKRRDRR
jgi:hypothetical protein